MEEHEWEIAWITKLLPSFPVLKNKITDGEVQVNFGMCYPFIDI